MERLHLDVRIVKQVKVFAHVRESRRKQHRTVVFTHCHVFGHQLIVLIMNIVLLEVDLAVMQHLIPIEDDLLSDEHEAEQA